MTSVVRAFSILGLALVAGLIHSWLVPISIAADGNKQTAQEQIDRMQGDPTNGDGQGELTDPGDTPDRDVPPHGTETVEPQGGEPFVDTVTDPKIHLSLAQFRTLYERHMDPMTGEVVLIDARGGEGAYAQGHILGAIKLTADMIRDADEVGALTVQSIEISRQFAPDLMTVIYCAGGDCDESENLRTLLVDDLQWGNVWIFEAGYPAWQEAGLPTAKGSSPFGQ